MADNYYGYKVRPNLFPGEDSYFKKNPHVSGMAAETGDIIFNPYSQNVNRDAVGANEAARLFMREKKLQPKFEVTPQQLQYFQGTPYANDPLEMQHTIIGRIISGDPSVGDITPTQRIWADDVLNQLKQRSAK